MVSARSLLSAYIIYLRQQCVQQTVKILIYCLLSVPLFQGGLHRFSIYLFSALVRFSMFLELLKCIFPLNTSSYFLKPSHTKIRAKSYSCIYKHYSSLKFCLSPNSSLDLLSSCKPAISIFLFARKLGLTVIENCFLWRKFA